MKLKSIIFASTALAGLMPSGAAVAQVASGTFASSIPNSPPPAVDAETFVGGIVSPSSSAFNINQLNATQTAYDTVNFQTGVASYVENGFTEGNATIFDPVIEDTLGGNIRGENISAFGFSEQNHQVSASGGVTVATTTSYIATDETGSGAISGAAVTTTEAGVERDYALTGLGATTVSNINVGGISQAALQVADAATNNYAISQGYSAYSTTGFDAETQTATVEQNTMTFGTNGASYTTYGGTASYDVQPVYRTDEDGQFLLDGNGNRIPVLDGQGLPVTTGGVNVEFDEIPVNQTIVTSAGVTTTGSYQVGDTVVNADGVSTEGSFQAGNVVVSGNTVSTNGNGPLVLHGGSNSTEVTLNDAGFSVASARFARDANGDVILDVDGNPTYEAGLTPTFSVSNEGAVLVSGKISGVVAGTADMDAANVKQVADGDAATLASANTFTTDAVAAEATLRADGDAATLASANTFTTDAVAAEATLRADGDAATLASANTFTTGAVAAEATLRANGDAATLASAKDYTDLESDRALGAEAALGNQIAAEVLARTDGDALTLASANARADAGDASTLASANARADAGDAATLGSAKSYADAGDAATLGSAQSYADVRDAATLASSKAYTDNAVSAERDARVAADNVLRDQIASSTATAIALGGAAILPDSNFTLSGNMGFYQGATAIAVNAAARVSESAYITGSFGGGLNKNGKVGGRVGVVFGF